jgi:Flp pilus assembly protein TadD
MNMHLDTAKRSIDAFNRALRLDPQNVDALEGLGAVYVSIGKNDLATGIHQELQKLDPDAASRLNALITRGIDWNR